MDSLTAMHPIDFRIGRVEVGLSSGYRIHASIRGVEIKRGCILEGVVGFGTNHKKAINALWKSLSTAKHIVLEGAGHRVNVRWCRERKYWVFIEPTGERQ